MKDMSDKKTYGYWQQFLIVMRKSRIPWIWVAVSFVVSLVCNDLMLELPTMTADLMSGKLSSEALSSAMWYYALFTIVICTQSAVLAIVRCLAIRRARECLWNKMLNIRVKYYDENDPDELMSTINNDLSSAMPNIITLCVTVIPDIWFLIMAMIRVADYNIFLLLSVLIFMPIKCIYIFITGRKSYKINLGIFTEIGGLTGYLADRIGNLPLIKAFTKEDMEQKNGEAVAGRLLQANMKQHKLSAVCQAVETLITIARTFSMLVIAVILLQKGVITMTQWVAFFLFSEDIALKFDALIGDWFFIKTTQGTIARAADILSAEEEDTKETDENVLPPAGDIEFDHVSFSYGEKKALDDVSFVIPQGSMTAIVGLCGSGKTTSLSLLERFYSPNEGQIRLSGTPIEDMSLSQYRRHFAYVQQNPEIFSGTAREALTYGIRREISDDEILAAAAVSGFAEYIDNQPKGLDTAVAAGGGSMSGGQRQRLVLTREFLRNSDILLLDEPTSALDANMACAIQRAVMTLFKGKTVIIVTHDMRLLEGMDQIIVLENGQLVGKGQYDELMRSCDLFSEMISAQEKGEEVTA